MLKYEELDPVIKELFGVCKVPEWDMNGDFAKEEFLAEKYGKESLSCLKSKVQTLRIFFSIVLP